MPFSRCCRLVVFAKSLLISLTFAKCPFLFYTERNITVDSYSVASRPPQRRYPRHRWPWELVYTFCECLTTVCIHGTCSDAQKYSLLGTSSSAFKRHKSGMKSRCGLMEFLQYGECSLFTQSHNIPSLP